MATEIGMPQMGYDMKEGTVVRWLASEGSEVKLGEAIAEIETDKAVVEMESTITGVLRKVLVSEGITVPVGQPIAIVGTADEEISEAITQTEAPEAEAGGIPLPPSSFQVQEAPPPVQEVRASPVARRLAEELNIDLMQVKGTGPGGRITRDDVLAFDARREVVPTPPQEVPVAPPVEPVAPALEEAPARKVPMSRIRQQIARVTVKSKREAPHFYVSVEIDMTVAMKMRRQINAILEEQGVRVTVNDLIVKACVGTLKKYPKFNSSYAEDSIQTHENINIGIHIAQEEGLIAPAIMDCANKSLVEVSRASKDLIARAKSGTLRPQEYTGGTFSLSNLGAYDVTSFTAIIQPPHAAILATGTVAKRPVVRDDQVTVAETINVTLSLDHRVADGAEGARFLAEIKRLLQDPVSLLV